MHRYKAFSTVFRRPLRSISGCPASRFSTRCASASIHQRCGENVSLGVPKQLHQPGGQRPSWSSRHQTQAKMIVPTATMTAMTTTMATNVFCSLLSSTRQNGPSTPLVALVVGVGGGTVNVNHATQSLQSAYRVTEHIIGAMNDYLNHAGQDERYRQKLHHNIGHAIKHITVQFSIVSAQYYIVILKLYSLLITRQCKVVWYTTEGQ